MSREPEKPRWWVYVVPKEEALYVGITTDPSNRLRQHGRPASCYIEGPLCRDEAIRRERALKSLSSLKKRDLIIEFYRQE